MALPQEHAPIATPLPDPPADDFLDTVQWDVLKALIDAVIPSVVAESTLKDDATQVSLPDHDFDQELDIAIKSMLAPPSRDVLRSYLESRPSQDPRFTDNLVRTLALSPPSQQKKLSGILSLMA